MGIDTAEQGIGGVGKIFAVGIRHHKNFGIIFIDSEALNQFNQRVINV